MSIEIVNGFIKAMSIAEEKGLSSQVIEEGSTVKCEVNFKLEHDENCGDSAYVVVLRQDGDEYVPGIVFVAKNGPEFDPYNGIHLERRRYAYEVAEEIEAFMMKNGKSFGVKIAGGR